VLFKLFKESPEYARKYEFWEGLLLNLQEDRTDVSSECVTMLAEYNSIFLTVQNYANNESNYKKALIAKGKANGGNKVGYWVNSIAKYSDIFVKSFDVYNTCDLDYYMIGMGTNFTTVQGGVDFIVSCLWLYLIPDS